MTLIALLLALAPLPQAADPLPPLPDPVYVAPADLDLQRALPPWPDAGTLASEADVQTLLALQLRRTEAEAADAQADSVTTMTDFTAKLLGPRATAATHPRLFALFATLHQDMRGVNRAANAARGFRQRPAVFDARVRPSLDVIGHGNASYPSARASSGQVWADVIAELLPDRAAAAQAEAERIAWRRVAGGVHYPSDIAGSRHVARAVKAALARSAKFQAALAGVRDELRDRPL